MTVVLVGVGADSTNATPVPPVSPDGRFEYVPIPESEPTTETDTYGTVPARHGDETLAGVLDAIDPTGGGAHSVSGPALADWPLHHDPNFAALTYGESPSRPAYTRVLGSLDPGDCLAFYTGLAADGAEYTHRYLIGYFTVESVHRIPPADPALLRGRLAANAHLKRHAAAGSVADGTVVVAGTDPGGRLPRAVRISTHAGGGHHYLDETYQRQWAPEPGGDPDRPAYLGGIKQIHRCRISPQAFLATVDPDRVAEHTSPS